MYDFTVLGAGPAGIQAAISLHVAGANYVVLERSPNASTHFRHYPRHRQLISINKRYTGSADADFNLRHDWNSLLTTNPAQPPFTTYSEDLYPSADSLVEYLDDVIESHSLNIHFSRPVTRVSRALDGTFAILSHDITYHSKYLLVATGGSPWYPQIPGLNSPNIDTYESHSLDRSEYINQKVLILGKGNSAFECAEYLSSSASIIHLVSPRQINFAWNTRYVGDLRSVRNNILDLYQLKSQFAVINASISSINETSSGFDVSFSFTYTPEDPNSLIHYDRIIACTGFRYIDLSLYDADSLPIRLDPRPELKGKFPLITPLWQFDGIPNMYALGSLMQTVSYRKNAGGFIHGFRYSIKSLINILLHEHSASPLPFSLFNSQSDLFREIVRRINTASSYYQMYGELCDAIVYDVCKRAFVYYYDLPLSYVSKEFSNNFHCILTFAISPRPTEDAFRYIPEATPSAPDLSVFIHPYLATFGPFSQKLADLHLLENIDIEWTDEVLHLAPLRSFLDSFASVAEHELAELC